MVGGADDLVAGAEGLVGFKYLGGITFGMFGLGACGLWGPCCFVWCPLRDALDRNTPGHPATLHGNPVIFGWVVVVVVVEVAMTDEMAAVCLGVAASLSLGTLGVDGGVATVDLGVGDLGLDGCPCRPLTWASILDLEVH